MLNFGNALCFYKYSILRGKKKDKEETDDTCNTKGTSHLGGLAWEPLPGLQPLVPG